MGANITPAAKPFLPNLPKLTPTEMMALSATEAVKYLRNAYGFAGLGNPELTKIIAGTRDGVFQKQIAEECKCSETTVKDWVRRAQEIHLLPIRSPTDRIDKLKVEAAAIEVSTKTLEQTRIAEDAKLAEDFRSKLRLILEEITPEKIKDAKLKDLVDAASKLLVDSRLLTNQSTVNTSQRTIVEHITKLKSMSIAEKLKLVKDRKTPQLPEPVDGQ